MNWTKYLPCLLILGMGSGCSSEVKHPGENQDLCLTDSLLKIVSVDTVHLHDVADELTLNGRVTFNQEQVAHVYPMFGGTVTELRAEVGDYVRKGDILAILRSGEVADYERQMKEAEQQVIIARRNVNATRDMFDSGLASDKDVLQARQELINAEAEENRIKEIFSINNFSGRSFYEVKSPVSGFIVEKSVSRNMQLRPDQGEEIFTVSGLEHVWVMADVYESDNLAKTINEAKTLGIKTYATSPDFNAKKITQVDFSSPSLCVIGNEANGVSDEVFAVCDEKITIPMLGRAESLNANVAAAITMWEMLR